MNQEYQDYLESESWKKLRLQILDDNNYQCIECGSQATEVHHKSYKHLYFDGEYADCEPLCYDCHREKHNVH